MSKKVNDPVQLRSIEERNQLVEDNMRLVNMVVWKYCRHFLPYTEHDELQSAGYIGLIQAATRFDETKGFKFSTYASAMIRGYIYRYVREHSTTIRAPRKVRDLLYHYYLSDDEMPTADYIATNFGMSTKQAEQLITDAYNVKPVSLESTISEIDGNLIELKQTLKCTVDFDSALNIEEFYATLTPKEKEVVRLRILGKKQAYIAQQLQVSQAHISRLLYGIGYKLTGKAASLKNNSMGKIFRLLEKGMTTKDIQQELGIDYRTVASCSALYKKKKECG